MNKKYEVAVNLQQDFTAAEQTQGRNNIGAASASDVTAIEGKIPSGASSSNKLVTASDLESAQDSWQSGFTPKGEATVSQINALTTQSNGDQYIVTNSGTITAGSVAVVAGDTVAWNATDVVWYKVNQYAKAADVTAIDAKIPAVASSSNKLISNSELGAYIRSFFGPYYYTIGGRQYTCVKIDGKMWMAENLDYKFNGCSIGSDIWSVSSPSAAYYNDDESTYGIDGAKKCGLLYNWYAAKYLNDNKETLIPGWHVPTDAELTALIDAVAANPATKLNALDNSVDSGAWPTGWNGTDNYGFGVLPSGYYGSIGSITSFGSLGSRGNFWSSNEFSNNNAWRRSFSASEIYSDNVSKNFGFSIRLVKD